MRYLIMTALLVSSVVQAGEFATEKTTTNHLMNVYFDTGSHEVRSNDKAKLRSLETQGKVAVVGHTDHRGTSNYNFLLASRRALEVGGLIETGDILYVINGEDNAKARDTKGMALERKVEVYDEVTEITYNPVFYNDGNLKGPIHHLQGRALPR